MTARKSKSNELNCCSYSISLPADGDYTPLTTTLMFDEDDTEDVAIGVRLTNDDVSEVRENFFGVISSDDLAITLLNNQSEVIIKDDEGSVIAMNSLDLYIAIASVENTTLNT